MALEAKYVYPPNWDGSYPTDQSCGYKQYTLNITGTSTNTEDDVQLVDISEMRTVIGDVPDRMRIDRIEWNVFNGFVELYWDRNPQRKIMNLSGWGKQSWRKSGGLVDPSPAGDETGDLYITNNAETFDINITFRLKTD